MDKLFIAKGLITRTDYMCSRQAPFEDLRLVMAPDEDAAERKYRDYWREQTEEYDRDYSVDWVHVGGVIS